MVESLATEFDILFLFMDEEVEEIGDGLEDLGIEIEIDVEFVYYAESFETFWRI